MYVAPFVGTICIRLLWYDFAYVLFYQLSSRSTYVRRTYVNGSTGRWCSYSTGRTVVVSFVADQEWNHCLHKATMLRTSMAPTLTVALFSLLDLPVEGLWALGSVGASIQRRKYCFIIWIFLALWQHCAVCRVSALALSAPSSPSSSTLKVAFVSGNAMKAREVQRIVQDHCFEGGGADYDNDNDEDDDDEECSLLDLELTVLDVDLPEIQEVDTLAIAKNKALLAAQLANGPCLVEDTSLCFRALGGMPGPYIKWFQETLRSEGRLCSS